MSQNIVSGDLAPGVRLITLNRPESLNALLPSMYQELIDMLTQIGRDPAVRVVVLTGAGKGFCAGADVSGAEKPTWIPAGVGKPHFSMHYMSVLSQLVIAIHNLPQPVIAAVNGSAAGFGYTIALACDLIIAAKSAKFVNAFHNAGTGSEGGLSYLLPRAIGTQRAAELLLTARPVTAEEAERIGLVLRCVPDEQLMTAVGELADAIRVNAPLDVWVTKQNMHQNMHAGSLEQAITFDTRATAMAITTEDAQEKRNSRREKREPVFRSL
jgi:enoyl-CoA hydratase